MFSFSLISFQVKNFNEEIWDQNKSEIVYRGNLAKFGTNSGLREKLLSTGNKILAEASPMDKVWGIGLGKEHENASFPERWPGKNLLGQALMRARETLAQEKTGVEPQ